MCEARKTKSISIAIKTSAIAKLESSWELGVRDTQEVTNLEITMLERFSIVLLPAREQQSKAGKRCVVSPYCVAFIASC